MYKKDSLKTFYILFIGMTMKKLEVATIRTEVEI